MDGKHDSAHDSINMGRHWLLCEDTATLYCITHTYMYCKDNEIVFRPEQDVVFCRSVPGHFALLNGHHMYALGDLQNFEKYSCNLRCIYMYMAASDTYSMYRVMRHLLSLICVGM